jgi:hypothetical protein
MPPSWCKGSPKRQRGGFAPLPDYMGSSAATPGLRGAHRATKQSRGLPAPSARDNLTGRCECRMSARQYLREDGLGGHIPESMGLFDPRPPDQLCHKILKARIKFIGRPADRQCFNVPLVEKPRSHRVKIPHRICPPGPTPPLQSNLSQKAPYMLVSQTISDE